jgi:hypothetical protein
MEGLTIEHVLSGVYSISKADPPIQAPRLENVIRAMPGHPRENEMEEGEAHGSANIDGVAKKTLETRPMNIRFHQ